MREDCVKTMWSSSWATERDARVADGIRGCRVTSADSLAGDSDVARVLVPLRPETDGTVVSAGFLQLPAAHRCGSVPMSSGTTIAWVGRRRYTLLGSPPRRS
jgi:hypothetical protein